MERESKISIALAAYNGAKFLPQQLESFLLQTRLPDEIVICDDRSQDETVEIAERFAERVSFDVKIYVNSQNLGSSKNFEKAISLCSGELIFLSDQDDVWRADKIEKIATEFEKSETLGLVFTDAELVDENLESFGKNLCDVTFDEKLRGIIASEKMLELLMPRNYITGATMAFKNQYKKFFIPIPTDIPELIHDAWIALVIVAKADFKFLAEPLIKYRQHENQQLGVNLNNNRAGNKFSQMKEAVAVMHTENERIKKIKDHFQNNPLLRDESSKIETVINPYLKFIEERAKHFEARTTLPARKSERLAAIIREWRSGRYQNYSKGWKSALKDMFSND